MDGVLPDKVTPENLSEFGPQIRVARKELGITQKRLAELVGCHLSHITLIETGTPTRVYAPTPELIARLNFLLFKKGKPFNADDTLPKGTISLHRPGHAKKIPGRTTNGVIPTPPKQSLEDALASLQEQVQGLINAPVDLSKVPTLDLLKELAKRVDGATKLRR